MTLRKAIWLAGSMTVAALAGCHSPPAGSAGAPPVQPIQPTHDSQPPTTPAVSTTKTTSTDVIATVGKLNIDRAELDKPLMEAYGFNMLLLIIQRDVARDVCSRMTPPLVVTKDDIQKEWEFDVDYTVARTSEGVITQEDRQKLLEQFLALPKKRDEMQTAAEFNLVVETNAYLRKIALANPSMKTAVTDDVLHQTFDELYGTHVRVRFIACSNAQEATQVKARLEQGADFATMARNFSRNPTYGPLGGELPPFTRNNADVPDKFREMAFTLKIGEVSDIVVANGMYNLIKLEQKVEQKAIKFDDVKESLREDAEKSVIVQAIKAVRIRLGEQVIDEMKMVDPTLKAEFDKRMGTRTGQIKDREQVRHQWEKERTASTKGSPTTGPSTTSEATATAPTAVPPATKSTTNPAPPPPVTPPAVPVVPVPKRTTPPVLPVAPPTAPHATPAQPAPATKPTAPVPVPPPVPLPPAAPHASPPPAQPATAPAAAPAAAPATKP